MRSAHRIAILALAAGLLSGCGSDEGGEPAEPAADAGSDQLVIVIEDFEYSVPESVPPGAEVVVRNEDGVGHTVTADEGETFDVVVEPGAEVTFTAPAEAGDHPFHCTPHPEMTGTLVVGEEG